MRYFTLSAVVTREGRVGNLELLNSTGGRWIPADDAEAKAIEELIGRVSRARFDARAASLFEPASMAGLPVAVNMVWLVAPHDRRARRRIRSDCARLRSGPQAHCIAGRDSRSRFPVLTFVDFVMSSVRFLLRAVGNCSPTARVRGRRCSSHR